MSTPVIRVLAALLLVTGCAAGPALAAGPELVSISTGSALGNWQSRWPAISGDARYVVFSSDASTLVPGDTNGYPDIFLRDRLLQTTTRISLKSDGSQASDAGANRAEISGDGQRIVFRSYDALVPGAVQSACYLLDRSTNTLSVVSTLPNGQVTWCSGISIDLAGRRLAIESTAAMVAGDTNGYGDVFVRDLLASTTVRVSKPASGEANHVSSNARISADGSQVLFFSQASNLVAGDTNGAVDLFLAASSGATPPTRQSLTTGGGQLTAPALGEMIAGLNADGSLLAFDSRSPSLPWSGQNVETNLYLRIPSLNETYLISNWVTDGRAWQPDFDYSGRWLVFVATDPPGQGMGTGVFVGDLVRDEIARIGILGSFDVNAAYPRISADGRGIVWQTVYPHVPGDTNGFPDIYYADNPLWEELPIFQDGFDG